MKEMSDECAKIVTPTKVSSHAAQQSRSRRFQGTQRLASLRNSSEMFQSSFPQLKELARSQTTPADDNTVRPKSVDNSFPFVTFHLLADSLGNS